MSFVHIIGEGTKMKKKMKKFTAVVAPVLAMSMALTVFWIWWEKKTTTTSSGGGEEKNLKLNTQKQVLNRTENQEIPTMDVSKSTDTLGSQILGTQWKVYIDLIKIISQSQLQQNLVRRARMAKNIHLNYVKMQNGQMVIQ